MKDDNELYAVVIGDKNQHSRYITTCPFSNAIVPASEQPLAVYLKYSRAQKARKLILEEVQHKAVHIVRFDIVV